MKKLLICGATGFIGRNLAEYYAGQKEYEVYGTHFNSEPYVCEGVNFVKADLTRAEDVDRVLKGMDIVMLYAANEAGVKETINNPHYHVTDNAIMRSLILRAAFENKIGHVVVPSCSVMYQPGKIPVKESDFNANDEIFHSYFGDGWTKVYIEKMCEFYSRISDAKFSVLRQANIYGAYDKYDLERSHVFAATITKVLETPEEGEIVVWGEGKAKRDLLYVNDLVEAVDLALKNQKEKFELVNIGSGEAVSVSDLVKRIIKISGRRLSISYDMTKPTITTELALDCEKAKDIYGWEKKTTLDDGIRLTLDWYQDNCMECE